MNRSPACHGAGVARMHGLPAISTHIIRQPRLTALATAPELLILLGGTLPKHKDTRASYRYPANTYAPGPDSNALRGRPSVSISRVHPARACPSAAAQVATEKGAHFPGWESR